MGLALQYPFLHVHSIEDFTRNMAIFENLISFEERK